MAELILVLNALVVIFHIGVVWYGWKLFKLIKPLPYWTSAWALFVGGSALTALRRLWSLIEYTSEHIGCPVTRGHLISHLVEILLLVAISITMLMFVCKLKKLFVKYLNGEVKFKN